MSTKKQRALALIVIVLVLPLLASCGSDDAFQTGQAAEATGQILFVADGNVMMWRNGKISTLTEEGTAESPSWSPIGDRFAYVQRHEDYSEVVIADRDGDPLVQLTSHDSGLTPYTEDHVYAAAWGKEPDWSPIGEELVYVSDKNGQDAFSRNLFVWLSEFGVGAAPYVLEASRGIGLSQSGPVYSPDGRQLAFSARQDEGAGIRYQEIWTLNLETATREALVTGTDGAFDPDWSPDGENIVYVQREGENLNIWVAPVSGDEAYRLADVGGASEPVWSPAGDQIAFIQLVGVEFEVWVMDVEADSTGKLTAGKPEELFTLDGIDASSGLSWFKAN